jgi:hypothetical protein
MGAWEEVAFRLGLATGRGLQLQQYLAEQRTILDMWQAQGSAGGAGGGQQKQTPQASAALYCGAFPAAAVVQQEAQLHAAEEGDDAMLWEQYLPSFDSLLVAEGNGR